MRRLNVSEREERREDNAFAALAETRPQVVTRVGDTGATVEPDRAVAVPDHDPDLRVRIDRHANLGIERVALEGAVADAGLGLVCQKAAVLDSEPRNTAANQQVRLNPRVGP